MKAQAYAWWGVLGCRDGDVALEGGHSETQSQGTGAATVSEAHFYMRETVLSSSLCPG